MIKLGMENSLIKIKDIKLPLIFTFLKTTSAALQEATDHLSSGPPFFKGCLALESQADFYLYCFQSLVKL
jgi:hypothetical protein